MAADPLAQVLRLVAEGRLTAEEAAPILAALDERGPDLAGTHPGQASPSATGGPGGATGRTGPATGPGPNDPGTATSLRIEVREKGRQVVNVRLPIGVGRFALDQVPGISGQQVDRVREALRSGLRGPVLEVNDGDDVVRIIVE